MGKPKPVGELYKREVAGVTRWDRESNFALDYAPANVASGREYQGANKALLTKAARARDQDTLSSFWATWKQWGRLGCKPRMGERPARIYIRGRYHCLWNFEQVAIPDTPGDELMDAMTELIDIENDRARKQTSMTGADYNAYRWGCVRAANER